VVGLQIERVLLGRGQGYYRTQRSDLACRESGRQENPIGQQSLHRFNSGRVDAGPFVIAFFL
jgi:hypothetical protein